MDLNDPFRDGDASSVSGGSDSDIDPNTIGRAVTTDDNGTPFHTTDPFATPSTSRDQSPAESTPLNRREGNGHGQSPTPPRPQWPRRHQRSRSNSVALNRNAAPPVHRRRQSVAQNQHSTLPDRRTSMSATGTDFTHGRRPSVIPQGEADSFDGSSVASRPTPQARRASTILQTSTRRRSSAIGPVVISSPSARDAAPVAPSILIEPPSTSESVAGFNVPRITAPTREISNPMDDTSAVSFALDTVQQEESAREALDKRQKDSKRPSSDRARRQSLPSAANKRRKSSFALFDKAFQRGRKDSNIDPLDNIRRSISTGAVPVLETDDDGTARTSSDTLAPPRPESHARSRSFAAEPRFTHPFQTTDGRPITVGQARRESAPLQRRPSVAQRLLSVSYTPNPVPQRYRSRSVASVAFFVSPMKRNNSVNPIFEEDILAEKANVQEFLEAAEKVQEKNKRNKYQMESFRLLYFVFIVAAVYFIFVGRPVWKGLASIYYDFIRHSAARSWGSGIFIGWAAIQAYLPLIFGRFEQEVDDPEKRDASETALIVPAYKAAAVLPETIKAALKIFKPEQIYIIANGNNPTPLDNTADVCKEYGVNHAWVPIGSKITAEFVGVALTRKYKYIMLIDDDVHLPPNLPLVTDRIQGNTKCIGYTIKSTGPDGALGTLINQCQDMEYKVAGMSRTFAGKYGSATFPHGAIILWERETLQNLFNVHPGYVISEDWYFGHCARASGYRIEFCSQVFVETETPPALFRSGGAARGGFGEMTVYKQRHFRWNYFFVYRIYDDGMYLLLSWRLGWRELITKFFVMIELYDSVMAIIRPWAVVLTLIGDAKLFFLLFAVLLVMYAGAFAFFNVVHLRPKKEMIQWRVLPVYMGMKFCLLWVTCYSVYRSLFHYGKYFMKKHPRLIESRQALEAAYNVRLGTALVPLDNPHPMTNLDAVEEEKEGEPGDMLPPSAFTTPAYDAPNFATPSYSPPSFSMRTFESGQPRKKVSPLIGPDASPTLTSKESPDIGPMASPGRRPRSKSSPRVGPNASPSLPPMRGLGLVSEASPTFPTFPPESSFPSKASLELPPKASLDFSLNVPSPALTRTPSATSLTGLVPDEKGLFSKPAKFTFP